MNKYSAFMEYLERCLNAAEFWTGTPAKLVLCSRNGVRVYGIPKKPVKGGYNKEDLLLVAPWPETWFRLYYLESSDYGYKYLRFSSIVIKWRL